MKTPKQGKKIRFDDGSEACFNSFTKDEMSMIYAGLDNLKKICEEELKHIEIISERKECKYMIKHATSALRKIEKTLGIE